jgi:hypothetical protein
MAPTDHATSPPSPPDPSGRRNRLITIAASVIILLGGLGMFAVIAGGGSGDAPRLNDNAVALTKYIGSKTFEELPFDQQRQYYKVLDDRDDELDQAYASKRLSESEYRVGLEAAWLGKHINRTEKYFSLPPGQARVNYVAKLLDKKELKRQRQKANPNPGDIDADETAAELKVEKWPAAVRSQWTLFHDAYRAQKKLSEKPRQPQSLPTAP